MKPGQALIVGLLVVLVVLIVAAFIWFNFTGWTKFNFVGAVPYKKSARARSTGWAAAGDKTAASLRFSRCTFTVVSPSGVAHSTDVTPVLNGMAVAFRDATGRPPKSLILDRPLNAFSFLIPGVNDSRQVPSAAAAAAWAHSATHLTGSVRTI